MTNPENKIQAVANLIKTATNVVVLTGAGISTPSGIPDFRSPGSGLWNQVSPIEVASSIAFRQDPEKFYNWIRPLSESIFNAKPNPAHYALAQLEAANQVNAVITQNIDGLHQAASSKNVLEVHGHIREFVCVQCYKNHNAESALKVALSDNGVPRCECGGALKPKVILFGEQLPVETLFKARHAVEQADLVIVVGSSLEVVPIADLPQEAMQRGARVVIINQQDTYLDDRVDVVIHENVTTVLPQVVEQVLKETV